MIFSKLKSCHVVPKLQTFQLLHTTLRLKLKFLKWPNPPLHNLYSPPHTSILITSLCPPCILHQCHQHRPPFYPSNTPGMRPPHGFYSSCFLQLNSLSPDALRLAPSPPSNLCGNAISSVRFSYFPPKTATIPAHLPCPQNFLSPHLFYLVFLLAFIIIQHTIVVYCLSPPTRIQTPWES